MKSPMDRMGFPPGIARKHVINVCSSVLSAEIIYIFNDFRDIYRGWLFDINRGMALVQDLIKSDIVIQSNSSCVTTFCRCLLFCVIARPLLSPFSCFKCRWMDISSLTDTTVVYCFFANFTGDEKNFPIYLNF